MIPEAPLSPKRKQTRAHLLDLGRERGYVVGTPRVAAEDVARRAKVSKRTLYEIFGSRDRFVAEVIRDDGDRWHEWFFDALAEKKRSGMDLMQAFLELLAAWALSPDFTGTLFARDLYMYPEDPPKPVREAMNEHLVRLREFLRKAVGAKNLDAAELELMLITVVAILGGVMHKTAKIEQTDIRMLITAAIQNVSHTVYDKAGTNR